MLSRLRSSWEQQPPRKKRAIAIALAVIGFIVVTSVGYKLNSGHETKVEPRAERKELKLGDTKMIDKSLLLETRKHLEEKKRADEEQDQLIEGLKAQITELKLQNEEASQKLEDAQFVQTDPTSPVPGGKEGGYIVPPPPGRLPSASPPVAGPEAAAPVEVMGGIEIVENEDIEQGVIPGGKKKELIYLPPSFMEATLISGLDAPTVEDAKGNPVPVLIRIRKLAILPNYVKADLKGCFAIAQGYGSLADERAHLRLVSLSCISKKGEAIIDQKVKGFVVDGDGKIGLRGKVVAKMGSMLARSMLAGFFGGIGEAVQQSSATQSVSALGTTSTFDSGEILQAGAGAGIAQAAQELQKFYLDLARQTLPVIEVGAAKTVTLVISEGVELEIKDYCSGGEECG